MQQVAKEGTALSMAERTGLLVIDMQKELLARPVFHKQALLENVNRLIARFREAKEPVFFIRHTNNSFLKEGTDGWQLDPGLSPLNAGPVLNKTQSSVFKEKAFRLLLEESGVRTLVITGLVSNGCVQSACTDALKQGYSVTLIKDAHSTFHKDAEKVIALWNAKLEQLGARLVTTEEYLSSSHH